MRTLLVVSPRILGKAEKRKDNGLAGLLGMRGTWVIGGPGDTGANARGFIATIVGCIVLFSSRFMVETLKAIFISLESVVLRFS